MRRERCCLLCYEADCNFCHRSLVAEQVILLPGVDVKIHHLTGPGAGYQSLWK